MTKMKSDNQCPRCREPDESVNHAIFECASALQTWALASTPSCSSTFHIWSVYPILDYFFWRKNDIKDPKLDRDPYP